MTPMPAPETDLAALRAEAAHLRRVTEELLATVAELRATVERQQAHIDELARLAFGRKSERAAGPALFDQAPDSSPPTPVDAPHLPGPPPASAETRRRGHGRRPLPADLPRERVEVDLTEAEKACPNCHRTRVRIGADVSERLDYRPASLFVRQTVRLTYACRSCERAGDGPRVARPPLPPEPIRRGTAAVGLLAHLIVSKYTDHLPLYRQESILARLGWEVTRSTLCDQVIACAEVLGPLYRLMCDRVRASASLHSDDTPVPLLAPRRAAHARVHVGDAANPYTVFNVTAGRSQDFPAALLAGSTGFPQADGYAGYNPVVAGGAARVGCWAHARRYFFAAPPIPGGPRTPSPASGPCTRSRPRRRSGESPVSRWPPSGRLAPARCWAFAEWLSEQRPWVLPKSPIGEALTNAANQWPTLGVYLTDGRLTIDNGPAERAIRPLCVGRRNCPHLGGDGGPRPTAVLLSAAASVKRHGIDPWAHLTRALTGLPARAPAADMGGLLPDSLATSRGEAYRRGG